MLCTFVARNFRIIEDLELTPGKDVTLFCGDNGAGKTSILEAVDFLSRGRSFRSQQLATLLRKGARTVTVSGTVAETGVRTHLGIQKSAGERLLHCNRQKVESISNHAEILPVVPLHPDSHRLVQGGARYRRNYLDWSAFHVKPDFLAVWREYSRCLRQRNQVLRQGGTGRELQAWTQEIAAAGERVSLARLDIFNEIKAFFDTYASTLLPEAELSLSFYKGWPGEVPTLEEALERAASREAQTRFTQWGPHRADIRLFLNRQPADQVASRGQQKLLAASLLLAQMGHLQGRAARTCVALLDDLHAELDAKHARALIRSVQALGCQTFISALDPDQVDLQDWNQARVFHVKHGTCKLLSE